MFNRAQFNRIRFNGPWLVATPTPTPTPTPTATNLKQAIVAALSAHAPTIAIVGPNVFPGVIPQTANLAGSAALSYRFVSNLRAMDLRGAAGLQSPRVRFRVSSYVMGDCEALLQVLRNLFQGLIGPLATLPIRYVGLENEVDIYDEPLPGSDLGTHGKEFDFVFKLPETIPTNT